MGPKGKGLILLSPLICFPSWCPALSTRLAFVSGAMPRPNLRPFRHMERITEHGCRERVGEVGLHYSASAGPEPPLWRWSLANVPCASTKSMPDTGQQHLWGQEEGGS